MALSSHGAEFIRNTEPHSALGGRVREGAHAARHVGRRRGVRWTVVYDGMNCGGRTPRSAPWPRRGEAGPRQRPQRTRHETDWAAHVYMELHWSSGAPRFILLRCRSRFITLNSLLRYDPTSLFLKKKSTLLPYSHTSHDTRHSHIQPSTQQSAEHWSLASSVSRL